MKREEREQIKRLEALKKKWYEEDRKRDQAFWDFVRRHPEFFRRKER